MRFIKKLFDPDLMWKEKLQAFCIGLEMNNVPELLSRATVGDFRRLGEIMSIRIKEKCSKNEHKPTKANAQ